MAIKISNTTVIADSRSLTNIVDVSSSGISTLGTVKISNGIVTATSGVVTYYGDGSRLTGAGSTVTNDTSTNATYYPLFTQTTSGTVTSSGVSTSKLTFNPSTGNLTAAGIVKSGGTSSQFLKADGSVDSTAYASAGKPVAMSIVFGF